MIKSHATTEDMLPISAIEVGPVRKALSSLFTMAELFSRHGCTSGMRLVALARDRIVEVNGTNPLAPSCGPGSGNDINNS